MRKVRIFICVALSLTALGVSLIAGAEESATVICGAEDADGQNTCRVESGRVLKGSRGSFSRYSGKKVDSEFAGYAAAAAEKRSQEEAENRRQAERAAEEKEIRSGVSQSVPAQQISGFDPQSVGAVLNMVRGTPIPTPTP